MPQNNPQKLYQKGSRNRSYFMSSPEQIQQLRSEMGVGIMDAKKALEESGDDFEKAREILRKKGAVIASKKSTREAKEGAVVSYIHANGKIGVILKLYCETDFVARTKEFQELANNLAMHIAAMDPQYVSPNDIPADIIETEKRIYSEQFADSGKPADILEDIIKGKIDKFASEVSLLGQPFVKDQDKNIKEVIEEHIAKFGENIQIGDFTRYEL